MRKVSLLAVALWIAASCLAKDNIVNIKGIINGYEGGFVQMVGARINDTLTVDKKGQFWIKRQLDRPQVVMFVVEQFRSAFNLYVENGMKGTVTVTFHAQPFEDQTMYVASAEYKGTGKDWVDLHKEFEAWEHNGWPFERIAQYDFPTYRKMVNEEADDLRSRINAVKSEGFKQVVLPRLENRVQDNIMRYAWAKHEVDPDFEKYLNSFERNNMEDYSMAFTYQRWWQGTHRPEEGFTTGPWYMEGLKCNFTNQEMINALAADYMGKYIPRAPKDLEASWEAFTKTCTDENRVKRLQAMYDKFNPGKDAPDFETVGYEDGKTYTLKDFRGKALMIDCWATWCGPCMAEMPYFAKLVEHYKNDNRIEFIAISFDNDKKRLDKELSEHPHPWRQFWNQDAFSSTIAKAYGFNGIPRFIFIDKNGKLIAGDAPRPSSDYIIQYIEEKLK